MTASKADTNQIVEQVAGIEGVMRDDIEVHDDSVTTYIRSINWTRRKS